MNTFPLDFNDIFETYCASPMKVLAQYLGEPVNISEDLYDSFKEGICKNSNSFGERPFHMVVNMRKQEIEFQHGFNRLMGTSETVSLKRFLRRIHPDYLVPFLLWGIAVYEFAMYGNVKVEPLKQSYRISIPLRVRDGKYYWFTQISTAIRLDENGNLVCHYNKYCYEEEFLQSNLKPVLGHLSRENESAPELNQLLRFQATSFILDDFTNAELELIRLYTEGLDIHRIRNTKKRWSSHTIHDLNKQIIAKTKKVFQKDFKDARQAAEFLKENHFLDPDNPFCDLMASSNSSPGVVTDKATNPR